MGSLCEPEESVVARAVGRRWRINYDNVSWEVELVDIWKKRGGKSPTRERQRDIEKKSGGKSPVI